MTKPLLQLFGEGRGRQNIAVSRATRDTVSQQQLSTQVAAATAADVGSITAGAIVQGVWTGDGPEVITHSLGRTPVGIIPVDISSGDHPRFRTDAKSDADITVDATSTGGSATVSFWIF